MHWSVLLSGSVGARQACLSGLPGPPSLQRSSGRLLLINGQISGPMPHRWGAALNPLQLWVSQLLEEPWRFSPGLPGTGVARVPLALQPGALCPLGLPCVNFPIGCIPPICFSGKDFEDPGGGWGALAWPAPPSL